MTRPNRPLWSVQEIDTGKFIAFDESTFVQYEMNSNVGNSLCMAHDLLDLPLVNALEQARHIRTRYDPSVDFEFCGIRVRYVCCNSKVITRLGDSYPRLLAPLRGSPDAVVQLSPDFDVLRAHRAHTSQCDRGAVLIGPQTGARSSIPPELPIVPHLWHPSLSSRFWALHSALLITDAGRTVAVCGNRRAGKTTAALTWIGAGLGDILTDELVLVDSVTAQATPVPVPVAIRKGPGREKIRSALSHSQRKTGRFFTPDVFLVLQDSGSSKFSPEPFRKSSENLLTPHVRPLRVRDSDVYRCLTRLLDESVDIISLKIAPWPDLRTQLADELTKIVKVVFA